MAPQAAVIVYGGRSSHRRASKLLKDKLLKVLEYNAFKSFSQSVEINVENTGFQGVERYGKNPVRLTRQNTGIIAKSIDMTGLFRLTPFDLTSQ